MLLRTVFVSAVVLAVSSPALADDLQTCRDRQTSECTGKSTDLPHMPY